MGTEYTTKDHEASAIIDRAQRGREYQSPAELARAEADYERWLDRQIDRDLEDY